MIDTFDAPRLRRIGLSALMQQRLGRLEPGDAQPMRITEVQRDALHLHDGECERPARALPALLSELALRSDALAVGDWVLARPGTSAEWWVSERVQPVTQIARRLHDGRSKVARAVIVSNVDTALLVMGLDHDFNPRRLERYLALARLAGVGAVVVLTKADLCPDVPARLSAVQALVPPGGAAVAVDATSDAPGTVLAPWLAEGQTLALLGSSGAGKSTLTNSLLGATVQLTGAVRKGDARGRHTTSSRSLHRLPGGACVIDTPGLRTLRLDGEEDGIAAMFDDLGNANDKVAKLASNDQAVGKGQLGLTLRPLQPDEAKAAGVPKGQGLLIEDVRGPAAMAGVQGGDVLLAVNGTRVKDVEQVRAAMAHAGKSVALLIERDGDKIFVPVRLG